MSNQPGTAPPSQVASANPPWPIYDLFLDLPHPSASSVCPGPFLIPSPVKNPVDLKTVTVPQVTLFAFPEVAAKDAQQQQQAQQHLNRFDMYAMQNPFTQFTHFTFSLQLENGVRLHGHCRRYMPPHLHARTRYDVGRRGERALVILTRATGADALSIEAISSQQAALSAAGKTVHGGNPQQWFLHQLSRYQQYLSQTYAASQPPAQGKPLVASIPGLEFGDHVPTGLKQQDIHRFILPPSLLQLQSTSSSSSTTTTAMIVPLLRCIGVPHALRLLSALLSERRVVLLSASPTRLTSCSQAALALLGAGGLAFHHVYIPVLPPHLTPYLAAPYPYLIGLLGTVLPPTDGLGEVVVLQLDTNRMETYNMESAAVVAERVPDLCSGNNSAGIDPNDALAQQQFSCADVLANELIGVLRNDKRVLIGDSLDKKVGEAAAKAKESVKKTFFKLREKGRQYLRGGDNEGSTEQIAEVEEPAVDDSMASDYIFTEGCHNEIAEHEARIALVCFFLAMYGNPRTFLSFDAQQRPFIDRKKFLQHHRYLHGSPLYQLLQNFCQTQMLEEYAMARTKDTGTMRPDAPLFLQCMSYAAQHLDAFANPDTLRRIVEQFAERNRGTPTNARQTAMVLTSNKAMETDNGRAIALLVNECRESSCVLLDVMSVIWLRLRDCKGLQWKHGFLALQLLRNLLYHGPLATVAEATDGLSKIRALKFYENSVRSQWSTQVRTMAASVYGLLVDRAKLFTVRRVCAERRRAMVSSNEPKRIRGANTAPTTPFRNLHAMMHPSASSGTVVQLPPKQQVMSRGGEDLAGHLGQMSVGESNANPFDAFVAPPPQQAQPPPRQLSPVPPAQPMPAQQTQPHLSPVAPPQQGPPHGSQPMPQQSQQLSPIPPQPMPPQGQHRPHVQPGPPVPSFGQPQGQQFAPLPPPQGAALDPFVPQQQVTQSFPPPQQFQPPQQQQQQQQQFQPPPQQQQQAYQDPFAPRPPPPNNANSFDPFAKR